MLQILKSLPDTFALRSLIQISSVFNALYSSDESLVYTAVTFNELLARNVDVFTPAPFIEISQAGRRGNVKPVLRSLHHQIRNKRRPLRLEPRECRILLTVEVLVLWQLKVDSDGEVVPVVHKEPTSDVYLYWDNKNWFHIDELCLAGKELSPELVDRCFAVMENSFKSRRSKVYGAAFDKLLEKIYTSRRKKGPHYTLGVRSNN